MRSAARRSGRPLDTLRVPVAPGADPATHAVETVPVHVGFPGPPAWRVTFHLRVLLPRVDHLTALALSDADAGRKAIASRIAGELALHGLAETRRATAAVPLAAGPFAAAVSAEIARAPSDRSALLDALGRHLRGLYPAPATPEGIPDTLPGLLAEALDAAVRERRAARDAARAAGGPGASLYASLFPLARSMRRELVLIVGPTNSGKTFTALSLAAAGATAVVLSPLRLLALEHYEALDRMGLSAGMLTGEERLHVDGATHLAQTVETMDPSREVDVAVVDEVQMLADPARGWAWTQALAGVPARRVVMTGSPDAIPLVRALAAMTGEPLEVRHLERKAPLVALPRALTLSQVERGDAVVAFSRKAAMALRDGLRALGHEVAMVYGNLSPEVRRAEASRFERGEADVMVATDAIGMGLNLPFRRVLLSELSKFDGARVRPLTDSEIRQVAGRAGRYGISDGGACGVLSGEDPARVARAVLSDPSPPHDLRLYVRPSRVAVLAVAGLLGTASLVEVLVHLRDTLVEGSPDLRMADLRDAIEKAALVDRLDLTVGDKLAYALAPVGARDPGAAAAIRAWAIAQAEGRPCECPDPDYDDQAGAEAAVRVWGAYLWLAWRNPDHFPDADRARALVEDADAEIEGWLRGDPWRAGARMAYA